MAGGSGKKGKKRQKNTQQSSQQNQDRPQTLPTESDFPTLGATANPNPATPRGPIQDERKRGPEKDNECKRCA